MAALLEDRRLRLAEERARRAGEAEQLAEAQQSLQRSQALLSKYTKDYLKLKHESLQGERVYRERIEALTTENNSLHARMEELRRETASELNAVTSGLWTLFAEPASVDDAATAYREAFPEEPVGKVEADVRGATEDMLARELIVAFS